MEEDLLMLLRRTPAVAELAGTRICLDERPQDSDEPAVVITRINGGHDHTLTQSAGWAKPTMHVMCFAPKATTADSLRDQVREAMNGFSGVVGETNFGAILLDDEDHDYMPPIDASDRGTYARLLVVTVVYQESIPTFS